MNSSEMFEKLLEEDGSFTVHQCNIQTLYVLNFVKYITIISHKLFSAICLHETLILIIYAWNPILSFRKSEQYRKNQDQPGITVQ